MDTTKSNASAVEPTNPAAAQQAGTPTPAPVEAPAADPKVDDADKGTNNPAETKDATVSSAAAPMASKH